MIDAIVAETALESKELDALRDKINKEISALAEKTAKVQGTLASLHSSPTHLLTSAQIASAHDLKISSVECLREEYKIRHRISAEYFPLLQAARSEAVRGSLNFFTTVSKNVREKLIETGYVQGVIPGTDIECLPEDFVRRHPLVHNAMIAYSDAQHRALTMPEKQSNDDAMLNLDEEIDAAIHRLTH